MQENKSLNNANVVEEEGLDIAKILTLFFTYWKLFLVSVILCLGVAAFYLYNAVPQYKVSAKILLADKEKGSFSSQADMLADFGFQGTNTNVENEIEVINSMSVARGAVMNSGVYISYAIPAFNDRPIYKNASPVLVNVDNTLLSEMVAPLKLSFTFSEEGVVAVGYSYVNEALGVNVETVEEVVNSFPYVLKTVAGDVNISQNKLDKPYVGKLLVTVNMLEATARSYMSRLSIAPVSKMSSVAIMSINTPVPAEGVDYLNAVITSYNDVTNEDKRQIARKTENFINERLDLLRVELKEKEANLSDFKRSNQLIEPKLDATLVSQNKSNYVKKLEEVDMLIKSSKYLNDFVNDPANDMKVIPTTFGMTLDPSLLALISNYNKEVIVRNEILLSATENNPVLKSSTARVQAMQEDLRIALSAFDESLALQRSAISLLVESYSDRYNMSPEIERELIALTRECDIKSGLYVMLLQKYEENALSLAVTADNVRCIDAPVLGGLVAPNKKMVILMALFMGLAIPAVYVYLRLVLRTQVTSVEEIARKLPVPIVGIIPVVNKVKKSAASVVVKRNANDVMAEAFRTLRTNLQFVMKKSSGKVFLFTSTSSGEGKTFIASNMAASMALLGMKVLLIGGDIRRPRLCEVFKFNKDVEGLTSYLASDVENVSILDKNIIKSNVVDGLDVLPAGIVPPNPAELLAKPNLDKAVEYLSEKYDYIIFDTAPVGIVTDSMIASRVADAVVYVLRLDYSHKEDVSYLNSLVAEGKLENVSVVVNGEDIKRKKYSAGYGRGKRYTGYGYGGYGYGGYGYIRYGEYSDAK